MFHGHFIEKEEKMSNDTVVVSELLEEVELAINATGDTDTGVFPSVQEKVRRTLWKCYRYISNDFE
ncbi:hypothetical protein VPPG_00023 [Vibrio phage VD1]|nr:hypothetical protein VPPG_00023 [Vibrio phage VD1]